MDIFEKLKRYSSPVKPPAQVADTGIDAICMRLNGEIIDPRFPPVIRIVSEYPHSDIRDRANPADNPFVHLPLLTRQEFSQPIRLAELLLFDLETTGLAGGTGTFPFLIGFGSFKPDTIEIVQYFLPDYGRESIAYSEIIHRFDDKKILVSFNGKSFDWPLLNNRFILNRFTNPFSAWPHLDLLHPARRIWKNLLESCSLDMIENEIFHFSRRNDISGARIPQVYFDYLRNGDIEDMVRVIGHNQQDILSLGRLLMHLHHLENGSDAHAMRDPELQNLCNLAIGNFDMRRSTLLLERMKQQNIIPSDLTLTMYSLLLKRNGQWQEAERIWHELIRLGKNTLFASEELAKYYEHQRGDLVRARSYTERALEYLAILSELSGTEDYKNEQQQFIHRLGRLQRKLAATTQTRHPYATYPDET